MSEHTRNHLRALLATMAQEYNVLRMAFEAADAASDYEDMAAITCAMKALSTAIKKLRRLSAAAD